MFQQWGVIAATELEFDPQFGSRPCYLRCFVNHFFARGVGTMIVGLGAKVFRSCLQSSSTPRLVLQKIQQFQDNPTIIQQFYYNPTITYNYSIGHFLTPLNLPTNSSTSTFFRLRFPAGDRRWRVVPGAFPGVLHKEETGVLVPYKFL